MQLKYEIHAQERAMERFGIFITIDQVKDIIARIHEGDAEYIGMGKDRCKAIWCIEFEGQKLYPMINFDRKFIYTLLTKSMAYKTAKRQRKFAK